MSQEIHAIYDSGLFRPLDPLDLPDGARVLLRVESTNEPSPMPEVTPEELAGQQKALREMFEIVDQLPQVRHDDGLCGRDHDQILYGPRK